MCNTFIYYDHFQKFGDSFSGGPSSPLPPPPATAEFYYVLLFNSTICCALGPLSLKNYRSLIVLWFATTWWESLPWSSSCV